MNPETFIKRHYLKVSEETNVDDVKIPFKDVVELFNIYHRSNTEGFIIKEPKIPKAKKKEQIFTTSEETKEPKFKTLKELKSYKELKILLTSEVLTEKIMPNQNITDRIKTFEDACAETNVNPEFLKSIDLIGDEKSILAYTKLVIIARALNEGWKPNWEDSNEQRWFPYFNVRGGFRFVDSGSYFDYSSTLVGSRLCFKTKALADYAGRQFKNEYRDFMLIEK